MHIKHFEDDEEAITRRKMLDGLTGGWLGSTSIEATLWYHFQMYMTFQCIISEFREDEEYKPNMARNEKKSKK